MQNTTYFGQTFSHVLSFVSMWPAPFLLRFRCGPASEFLMYVCISSSCMLELLCSGCNSHIRHMYNNYIKMKSER